jgi:hypothetical protein
VEESPKWQRLWWGDDLSDDEFDALMRDLSDDLVKCRLEECGEVLHVAGMLLHYKSEGVYREDVDIIIAAQNCLTRLVDKDVKSVMAWAAGSTAFEAYEGLGFMAVDNEHWKSLAQYIRDRAKCILAKRAPQEAQRMQGLMHSDAQAFAEEIRGAEGSFGWATVPVLHHIDIGEVVDAYLGWPWMVRKAVESALIKRYELSQSRRIFAAELEWLGRLNKKCLEEAAARSGRMSAIKLRRFCAGTLNSILDVAPPPC